MERSTWLCQVCEKTISLRPGDINFCPRLIDGTCWIANQTNLPKERDLLLQERGKTHGEFKHNALVSQALKSIMKDGENWSGMEAYQREALEMIAHKIGRILSGDTRFQDHWDDIAGYAKLVSERVGK